MKGKKNSISILTRLQAKLEKEYKRAVKIWLKETTEFLIREFNRVTKADFITPFFEWEFVQENGKNLLNPVTLKIYQEGQKAARNILQIKGAFDIGSPETVTAARTLTANLITQVTEETKRAVSEQVALGIERGQSNAKIAKELRSFVGLNARQAQAIRNLGDELREKGVNERVIQRKMRVKHDKALIQRTNMIARTETARAQNLGYSEQLRKEGVGQVEFSAYPGCCDSCQEYDGDIHPVSEARGLIPVHPNCRCALLPVV